MRWLPNWPLPRPPAFVPGQMPRPAALRAPEPVDCPPDAWRSDEAYLYGVDLYSAGFVWEAHEAWESPWRAATDAARRELLQGLIQVAAAAVKARAGRPSGVRTLAARGAKRLDTAAALAGSPVMGLDVSRFVSELGAWASSPAPRFADRPKIRLEAQSR